MKKKPLEEKVFLRVPKEKFTALQIRQITEYFSNVPPSRFSSTLTKFRNMVERGVSSGFVPRLKRLDALLYINSLKTFVLRYGKILGRLKFDEYREKHRVKNTFEHKQTLGWSEKEFKEYNQMRSQTKANMIARYGEEEGSRKWDEYRTKQKDAGCSKDYFVKKHGDEIGLIVYENLNKQKAHTLDSYVSKYGEEDGFLRYSQFWGNQRSPFSKVSQELFVFIEQYFSLDHCYYATRNKEFGIYDAKFKCYRKYDFVDVTHKICIEFNGDIYHANPLFYSPDDVPKSRGNRKPAKELWMVDYHKHKLMVERGFEILVVWEYDYKNNFESVKENICNWFLRQQEKLKLNQLVYKS